MQNKALCGRNVTKPTVVLSAQTAVFRYRLFFSLSPFSFSHEQNPEGSRPAVAGYGAAGPGFYHAHKFRLLQNGVSGCLNGCDWRLGMGDKNGAQVQIPPATEPVPHIRRNGAFERAAILFLHHHFPAGHLHAGA